MPHNIEIGSIGTFTDGKGITKTFDDRFMSDVTSSYNPDNYKAPFIISHDTKGIPDDKLASNPELSFGFPSAVKRVKDKLVAVYDEISPRIKKFYKQGDLLSISPSFYPPNHKNNPTPGKWSLRHVAGLGVTPPAIKGLASPALAFSEVGFNPIEDCLEFCMCGQMEEDEEEQLTFSMGGHSIAETIGKLRDWLIEQSDSETAEKIIPSRMIENIRLGDRIKDEQMDRLEEKVYKIMHKLDGDNSDGSMMPMYQEQISRNIENMPNTKTKQPTHVLLSTLAAQKSLEFSDIATATGLTQSTVGSILLGAQEPSRHQLGAIANALEIEFGVDDEELEFEGHGKKSHKMKKKKMTKEGMDDEDEDEDEDEEADFGESSYLANPKIAALQRQVLELQEQQKTQERINRVKDIRTHSQLQQIEQEREAFRQEQINSFCEGLVSEGKLLANQIGDFVIDFGESDDDNFEMSLPTFLSSLDQDQLSFAESFLENLTPQLNMGEFAKDNEKVTSRGKGNDVLSFSTVDGRAVRAEEAQDYQSVIDYMENTEGFDPSSDEDFDRAALIVLQ